MRLVSFNIALKTSDTRRRLSATAFLRYSIYHQVLRMRFSSYTQLLLSLFFSLFLYMYIWTVYIFVVIILENNHFFVGVFNCWFWSRDEKYKTILSWHRITILQTELPNVVSNSFEHLIFKFWKRNWNNW